MAVLAAPILPTSPTEPFKGACVSITRLALAEVIVITAPLTPAPNVYQFIAASTGHAL